MSSINTVSGAVSRPKIHRLPSSVTSKAPEKRAFPGFLVFWGGMLVVLGVLAMFIKNQHADTSEPVATATMLPKISVTPSDPATEEPSMLARASSVLSPPIADAQAAPTQDKSGKTILFHGQSETIVGQMAKIPVENEQITEIKAVSDIDNSAGRELLSIISKY